MTTLKCDFAAAETCACSRCFLFVSVRKHSLVITIFHTGVLNPSFFTLFSNPLLTLNNFALHTFSVDVVSHSSPFECKC